MTDEPRVLLDRTQWEPDLVSALGQFFPDYPVHVAWWEDSLIGFIHMMTPDGETFSGNIVLNPHEANNAQVDKPTLLRFKASNLFIHSLKTLAAKGVAFHDCIPLSHESYKAVNKAKRDGKKEK